MDVVEWDSSDDVCSQLMVSQQEGSEIVLVRPLPRATVDLLGLT